MRTIVLLLQMMKTTISSLSHSRLFLVFSVSLGSRNIFNIGECVGEESDVDMYILR